MENLLKKVQIIQFIIIISFFILSNTKKEEHILNKNTKYYHFLLNIVKYNSITKKFVKKILKIKVADFWKKENAKILKTKF